MSAYKRRSKKDEPELESVKIKHIKVTETNKYPTQGIKRDRDCLHLYTNGEIKVLTVDEYLKLKSAIPKDDYKIILDVLLITGMRYIEVCRLYKNHEWYNERRNLIHLPAEAQLKHERCQPERTIQGLPEMFNLMMKMFFTGKKPPVESSWNRDLQRWAKLSNLNPYGISGKTSRKTCESWQIVAGVPETTVCLRSGHTTLVSMLHYQNLAFSDDEIRDIEKQLKGWGMLK